MISVLSSVAEGSVPFGAGGLVSGVVLMIVGMFVVFGSLLLIMGLVGAMNRLLQDPTPTTGRRDIAERVGSAPLSNPPAEGSGVTPELVAVLTAAAYAATQRPVRVRRITVVGSSGGSAWLAGGRASLMGSHRPVRRRV